MGKSRLLIVIMLHRWKTANYRYMLRSMVDSSVWPACCQLYTFCTYVLYYVECGITGQIPYIDVYDYVFLCLMPAFLSILRLLPWVPVSNDYVPDQYGSEWIPVPTPMDVCFLIPVIMIPLTNLLSSCSHCSYIVIIQYHGIRLRLWPYLHVYIVWE